METDLSPLQRFIEKIDLRLSRFDRDHLTGYGQSGIVIAFFSSVILKAVCRESSDEPCTGLTHPLIVPFIEMNINAIWTIGINFYLHGISEEVQEYMLLTR